ncbi:hypothetical protein BKA69DRAFT_827463 [Paraphysoderma sedebokerense]|nr:hypothetical protein BKA69DRAFT_827463 [Paraphysoderma sedebokerense]
MDSIAITYHDVSLYETDLQILRRNRSWINDNLIDFWFEYSERQLFPHLTNIVTFLRPSVVKLFSDVEDPRYLKSALPPSLDTLHIAFLPVNDNRSDAVGGSHWSLLVFVKPLNTFYYYDSSGAYNISAAKYIASKWICLLNPQDNKYKFEHLPSPQQQNNHDCGLFVMCYTFALCCRLNDLYRNTESHREKELLCPDLSFAQEIQSGIKDEHILDLNNLKGPELWGLEDLDFRNVVRWRKWMLELMDELKLRGS